MKNKTRSDRKSSNFFLIVIQKSYPTSRPFATQNYKVYRILSSSNYTVYASGYNSKEYVRNQNVLSDWEDITISTDSNNPTVMRYDGFLIFGSNNGNNMIVLNGQHMNQTIDGSTVSFTMPFSKGDLVYMNRTPNLYIKARYYKLRDYTGR